MFSKRLIYINKNPFHIDEEIAKSLHQPYGSQGQDARNKLRYMKKFMTTVETGITVKGTNDNLFKVMLVTGVAPNLNTQSAHNQYNKTNSDAHQFLNQTNTFKRDNNTKEPLVQKSLRQIYFNELEKAYFNGANAFIYTLKMTGYYKGTHNLNAAQNISKTAFNLAKGEFEKKYGDKAIPTITPSRGDAMKAAQTLHNTPHPKGHKSWKIALSICGADNSSTGNINNNSHNSSKKPPQEESIRIALGWAPQKLEAHYQTHTNVIFSEKLFHYSFNKKAALDALNKATKTDKYQSSINKQDPGQLVTLKTDQTLTAFYYSALFAKKNPNNPNKYTADMTYLKSTDDTNNVPTRPLT